MSKTKAELEQEIESLKDQLRRAIEQDYCTLCGRLFDDFAAYTDGVCNQQEQEKQDLCVEFMRAIHNHCVEGGSFRYLIYDRLGLKPSAYQPMHEVGGMAFSNACPIENWGDNELL